MIRYEIWNLKRKFYHIIFSNNSEIFFQKIEKLKVQLNFKSTKLIMNEWKSENSWVKKGELGEKRGEGWKRGAGWKKGEGWERRAG